MKLLNAMKSLHGLPRLSQPLRFMCNDGNDAPPEIVQNHFQSEFRRRAEAFFVAVFFASIDLSFENSRCLAVQT